MTRSANPVHTVGRWLFLSGIAGSSWIVLGHAGIFLGDVLFFAGGLVLLLTRARGPSGGANLRAVLIAGWLVLLSGAVVAVRYPSLPDLATSARVALVLVAGPVFMLAFVTSARDAVLALGALFASATVNGAFAVADLIFGLRISPDQLVWNEYPPLALTRAVGLTSHPNVLGYVVAVTLPLAPVMFGVVKSRPARWALACSTGLMAAGLMLSGSRGAAIGAGSGLLYVLLRSSRRGTRSKVVGTALALVPLSWLLRDAALLQRLLGDATSGASDASRRQDLAEGARSVLSSFPTGVGFEEISQIHSGILAILAAGGVIGLAGFALWGRQVGRAVRQGRRSTLPVVRALAVGCGGASIGMAVFLLLSPIIFHRYAVVPASVVMCLHKLERSGTPTISGSAGGTAGPTTAPTVALHRV